MNGWITNHVLQTNGLPSSVTRAATLSKFLNWKINWFIICKLPKQTFLDPPQIKITNDMIILIKVIAITNLRDAPDYQIVVFDKQIPNAANIYRTFHLISQSVVN